jgi:hypothetical protein
MAGVTLSEEEMAKLCAWIDLCIPHGGKYTDDMKQEHARFYEQRLLIRRQEETFEARNIDEFVKNGGYNNSNYGGTIMASGNQGKMPRLQRTTDNRKFNLRFLPGSRRFVVNTSSAGHIELFDLKGRTVFSAAISNEEFGKSPEWEVPVKAPPGLYIVKFKGTKNAVERVISVF